MPKCPIHYVKVAGGFLLLIAPNYLCAIKIIQIIYLLQAIWTVGAPNPSIINQ